MMLQPRIRACSRVRTPSAGVLLLSCLIAGCRAIPVHHKGEEVQSVRVSYGDPIPGHVLAWNAAGEAESVNITVADRWFLTDRLSLGVGLTASNFDQEDESVLGGEIQGLLRWHFTEWKELSFFWDLDGGGLVTTEAIPPMSTSRNYTFDFGPGVEWSLDGAFSLLFGVQFHHLSNARGRESESNESQNEIRFGIECAWSL